MARKAGGKLKKTLLISCILLILITFGGCVIATDFYSGKDHMIMVRQRGSVNRQMHGLLSILLKMMKTLFIPKERLLLVIKPSNLLSVLVMVKKHPLQMKMMMLYYLEHVNSVLKS